MNYDETPSREISRDEQIMVLGSSGALGWPMVYQRLVTREQKRTHITLMLDMDRK